MADNAEFGEDATTGEEVAGPIFWRQPLPQNTLEEMADLSQIDGQATDRLSMYGVYENFYAGEQGAKLLDRALEYLEQVSGVKYAENICDVVVNSMANKLQVVGWSSNPESEGASNEAAVISEINALDEELKTAISRTCELGDGFLIVDYDEEHGVSISYNNPSMMKACYDPGNPKRMLYAVKKWKTHESGELNPAGDGIERMNVYYEDRIERYFSVNEDGDWVPWIESMDEEYWPIPWTRTNEPPTLDEEDMGKHKIARGVPVFHLKNNPRGKQYGTSELHKVIPMQLSLNKLWLDFFEVADYQGYPQRWGTGLTAEDQNSLVSGSGTVWGATATDAKFGQFPAADLAQLIEAINFRYKTIGGMTSTPLSELMRSSGTAPSGESIRKAEGPLIDKVQDRQPSLGHPLGAAMTMAMTLLVDNGKPVPGWDPDASRMEPQWAPAERVDMIEKLAKAEAQKRLGIPMKRILEELGYDNADELLELMDQERDEAIERHQRTLIAGGLPDTNEDE